MSLISFSQAVHEMAAAGGQGSLKEAFKRFLAANNIQKVNLQKRLQGNPYYDSREVAATVVNFFTGAPVTNNVNFKGNSFTLPEDEHQVVHGIWIQQGTNASIPATDWAYGATSAPVKNGTIQLINNGSVVTAKLALAGAMTSLTNRELGYIPLNEPFLWAGQTEIKAVVEFPVAPAATTNLRITLDCFGLVS